MGRPSACWGHEGTQPRAVSTRSPTSPGVLVGHVTRDEPGWLTGVTVVVPPPGTTGGVDVRGGAPGTRETDLLDPTCLVDRVDAVVLSGGSAFGLATADGVMQAAYAAGLGWPVGAPGRGRPDRPGRGRLRPRPRWRLPHHPDAADGRDGLATTPRTARSPQGAVGAGTGARAGGLRGGVGSASAVVDGVSVGALVVVNAMGSPCAPRRTPVCRPLRSRGRVRPRARPRSGLRHRPTGTSGPPRRTPCAPGRPRPSASSPRTRRSRKVQCRGPGEGEPRRTGAGPVTGAHGIRRGRPLHPGDGRAARRRATSTSSGSRPLAADCVTRAVGHAMLAATSVDRTADGGVALVSWRDRLDRDALEPRSSAEVADHELRVDVATTGGVRRRLGLLRRRHLLGSDPRQVDVHPVLEVARGAVGVGHAGS